MKTDARPANYPRGHTAHSVKKSYGARSRQRQAVAALLRHLMDDPEGATTEELREVTGMSPSTLRSWVQALRAAQVVRIVCWPFDGKGRGGAHTQQLGLNLHREPDAPRPKPKPNAERVRTYRANRRKRLTLSSNALMNGTWLRDSDKT